jgi:large subunit ribosomal protein L29
MKPSELRGLSGDELKAKEAELARELFNVRFVHASGRMENTARLKKLRRDLARVKTILRQQGQAGLAKNV